MGRNRTIPQSASLTAPFTQRGLIIGITGGSGSGKSTLSRELERRGWLFLDCDAIYHDLLHTDESLLAAIESRFPGTVENGILQRKKLGSLVFSDPQALLDLNTITHGAVKKEVLRCLEDRPALAALDAIARFEGELAELCDVTVAVTAPREDRIARLMCRVGFSREYATARIDAQHTDSWFREHCDHVLENTGEFDAFATKCLAFFARLGIM